MENFKKLYANALKGKIVHLFVSQYELDKNIDKKTQWRQIAKNNKMELVFHTSRDPEHDRYIFLENDMFIYIGLGTDLLDVTEKTGKTGKTREITMIHIVQNSDISIESLCKKHSYSASKSFNFNFRDQN